MQLRPSFNKATSNHAAATASQRVTPVLKVRDTLGNQAMLQTRADHLEGRSDTNEVRGFAHDFSQMRVNAGASAKLHDDLALSNSEDICEQEADRASDVVVRMSQLQMAQPNQMQARSRTGTDHAAAVRTPVLNNQPRARQMAGSGAPLPVSVREALEPHFGYDFSRVQIHDNERAARLADVLQARAFTLGSDIYFGKGEYVPEKPVGLRLLAHELTHVVQQRAHARVQRQLVPQELQSSANVRMLDSTELQRRYDLIVETMKQLYGASQDYLWLEEEMFRVANELARRAALQAKRTFGDAEVEKMKQYFIANATSASPKSCIACMNDALKILIGDPSQKVGSEVEKTMAKLQASGHAGAARVIEFEDKRGRITKGTLYPDRLHESVWGAVIDMAGGDVGWSIFGMSLMDGNHSVTLTLDNGDPLTPHVHWSDQWSSKGGWREYDHAGLDAEITRLTQGWWNKQPQNRKFNTRVTLWRLNQ
jgi:hypothetical protein